MFVYYDTIYVSCYILLEACVGVYFLKKTDDNSTIYLI